MTGEQVLEAALPLARPVEATGILSPRYRAITLGMVALVSLTAFEALAVATAMPTVATELGGLGLYALAFGGTLAAGVVGMTVAGRLADSRGPAIALWHGVAWFVAGLLLAGFAPTMTVLLLGRIVQGLGAGMLNVAVYVVVGRVFPKELRPRVFASFAAAWVVPSLVGPSISAAIVEYTHWRWVFLAVPLLAVPAALVLRSGMRELPSAPASAPSSLRRVGWALGAALGAVALHYGGQQRGALAAVLIATSVIAIVVSAIRLLPAGTLRARRGLPAVIALRGIAAAAFFGTETFLPLMLSREHGLSPGWAGLALTIGALGWSAGSQYQSRGRWRVTRSRLVQVAMIALVVGIAVIGAALVPGVPVAVGIAGWLLAGLGMGIVYPSLSVMTLELSPPEHHGANSSALQLSDSLTIATVLALVGSVFAALLSISSVAAFGAAFAITAALAVIGVVVAGRTAA